MTPSLLQSYDDAVTAGRLTADAAQRPVLQTLDALACALNTRAEMSRLRRFFVNPPRGLYLWGGVGRGKTMLMDMFFASLTTDKKRRVHFHAFMQDVHARIFNVRATQPRADALIEVADALAREASIMCFDEMAVTDVADAMILARLFTRLWDKGVTVIATSNISPDRLYEEGLNRPLFLPFVALLQQKCVTLHMPGGDDHRLVRLQASGTWFEGAHRDAALQAAFDDLKGDSAAHAETIPLKGRSLHVRQVCGGAALFSFAELCDAPLGAEDYLEIAQRYHTVFLNGIPRFTAEMRNPLRRFITLVDILYDGSVNLVASAAAAPQTLLADMDGYEKFGFERTASRLIEMQSVSYLGRAHAL